MDLNFLFFELWAGTRLADKHSDKWTGYNVASVVISWGTPFPIVKKLMDRIGTAFPLLNFEYRRTHSVKAEFSSVTHYDSNWLHLNFHRIRTLHFGGTGALKYIRRHLTSSKFSQGVGHLWIPFTFRMGYRPFTRASSFLLFLFYEMTNAGL